VQRSTAVGASLLAFERREIGVDEEKQVKQTGFLKKFW
jgi:hypothetical protein